MNASTSSTAKFSLRPRLILLAVLLCLACGSVLAQSSNLDYTNDMPSVDRVKAEIKGSDPTDTLARQVAVFTYLQAYVQRIKYNRSYSGPFTPGEQRVIAAYSLAAYQMSQDYAKTHTPAEAAAFERLPGQYEMNSDFYRDWSKRLIGKQSAAAYHGMESDMGARQQAHVDSIKRANEEAAAHTTNAQGLSNDPTAVTTRRCLELGGNSTACMGKGFMGGILSMAGMDSGTMQAITGPGRAGIVLSGLYHSPSALAAIDFTADSAAIENCGKLVADGHPYTLHKGPSSLGILIQNEPRPIQLSMRPDGALTGPGLVDVKGRIIIGYHTVTSTLMINGARAAPDQCNGPCQTSTQVPDYAPKMERCTIASLAPPPPAPRASASAPEGEGGIFGALTSMVGTIAPASEPGLRAVGKYSSAGGGLLLDFGGDAVTLDCGQAHVKAPYTVENTPARFVVNIQNNGGPFTLAVAPDNTLRGSGSTTVNGRLVSGMNGDNVAFTPHSESCNVGSFAPKIGASSSSIAANSPATPPRTQPVSAPATVAYTPAAGPSSTANTAAPSAAGARAAMRVAITADFPPGANPMVGRSVFVMRERIDEVLRKLGIAVPSNSTPGKAVQALATACRTQNCAPVMSGLDSYYITHAKLDGAGKATLTATAATGPYFFFALFRNPDGSSLVWDIPTTLHAGDNTITLAFTNAEIIH
jgi:hypothetical protein